MSQVLQWEVVALMPLLLRIVIGRKLWACTPQVGQ
ncbi:hypothetical protein BVRB_3g066040 [Beta vulgaris subsp. vulgaris]|nr:hypothetical protein BVRB_3g066040 [Beta vulgaris subsp. vulgaris]